jgi:hypothetical protein
MQQSTKQTHLCDQISANFGKFVTLSVIRRTACARAQFSGCSSKTNAHSETEQIAVYCQKPDAR